MATLNRFKVISIAASLRNGRWNIESRNITNLLRDKLAKIESLKFLIY
jgi:hypothetical protein